MGLLSYISEYLSADPSSGYIASLFTLDFSDAVSAAPEQQTAFEEACRAAAALFTPPSRCYPGQNFQVKIVLASDHEISSDLFSFQIIRSFTSVFQTSFVPDKIRVYPAGTARGENRAAAIESFLA